MLVLECIASAHLRECKVKCLKVCLKVNKNRSQWKSIVFWLYRIIVKEVHSFE